MASTKIVAAPGTPAAELEALADQEHVFAEREARLLARGAELEVAAREIQAGIDEARASLQQLAYSPAHQEAEGLFNRSLSLIIPPHVATAETSRALVIRKEALQARTLAVGAEETSVVQRAAVIQQVRQAAAILASQSAELLTRVREAQALQAQQAVQQQAALAQQQQAARIPQPAIVELTRRRPSTPPPVGVALEGGAVVLGSIKRREHKRVQLQAEVTLQSESNFFAGFTRNISEAGLFVATYEKRFPPGTEVELTVNLYGKRPLTVHGTVKWIRDASDRTPGVFPGMGIAFHDVSPEAAQAVKAFMAQRDPMFWAE